MSIRVRVAPSPTGSLHIGTARTAIFNFLYAQNKGAELILRSEDTDEERSTRVSEQDIMAGLAWLGLIFTEGVCEGGEFGPYRQSERKMHYQPYLEELLAADKAYPCYCTTQELAVERAEQIKNKQAPIYSGRCRHLTPEQRAELAQSGRTAVIRFAVPEGRGLVKWQDLIRGEVVINSELLGDFVIAKSLTQALYNFVVVIDDHEMKISDVLRGEDHISNTPKQILLYEALGFVVPHFGHMPLLLNPDKSKMSKRSQTGGSVWVTEFRQAGILPQALFNYLSTLGWNDGSTQEIYSLTELSTKFNIKRVNKSGAIYDYQRLLWFNAHYLRNTAAEELFEYFWDFLIHFTYIKKQDNSFIWQEEAIKRWGNVQYWGEVKREYLERAFKAVVAKMTYLTDFFAAANFYFYYQMDKRLLANTKMKVSLEEALTNLQTILPVLEDLAAGEWVVDKLRVAIIAAIADLGLKNGQVLWPLRVAITGQEFSIGAFEACELLGKNETLHRVQQILAHKA